MLAKWTVPVLLASILLSSCARNLNDQSALTDTLPTPTPQQTFSGIPYDAKNPQALGYLAVPAGEGPYPALILIHEWWGLNDNIRSLADDFSYQGYVALAIDLYNGQSTTDPGQAGTLANSVRDNPDQAFINLQAAVNYLKSQSYVDPTKLASVGWCFGGGWSYQMAKNDLGTRASVMYYGQFNKEDDLSHMTSLIQGHFGAQDQSIPVDSVKAFQAKLKTLSGEHEVYIYENAGHAFANADNQAAYRQESAKEAWDRTLTFLNKVFPDQN